MIRVKQFQQLAIKRYFELLRVLVERNLKSRYRGSILGIYWSLLNPLIMTGLYTAVFELNFSCLLEWLYCFRIRMDFLKIAYVLN